MSELLQSKNEFELSLPIEHEKKYLPIFPDQLLDLREQACPIEQFYLSHPSEPFSLRFRETLRDDGTFRYQATLKDRGIISPNGELERLEVEIDMDPKWYHYYKTNDIPVLKKLRTTSYDHVVTDFTEDGRVGCESESPEAWQAFVAEYGDNFVEVTGDRHADNEWYAHLLYRRQHEGQEALRPQTDLDPQQIVQDILSSHTQKAPVVIRLFGRSGSGKSTIVRQIQAGLQEYNLESEVISTDDYHQGATWLTTYNNGSPWTEWDHPIVYDTEAMAANLKKLLAGESIPRREIDFSIVEPTYQGDISPVPVVIIEGIYARSSDLTEFDALDYEIPTPIATCIGRRLIRDMRERPQFANPEESFRYMLEQAEPMWRDQLSE